VAIEYETPGVHQERGDNGEGRGQMATALGMGDYGLQDLSHCRGWPLPAAGDTACGTSTGAPRYSA
jgi:hypothetical protein